MQKLTDDQGRRLADPAKPMTRSIEVTTLQAGQAKPYADSWYRYLVRIEGGWPGHMRPSRLDAKGVVAMAQPLIPERLYWGKDAPDAFVPVIQVCDEIEPGEWLIEARALYND